MEIIPVTSVQINNGDTIITIVKAKAKGCEGTFNIIYEDNEGDIILERRVTTKDTPKTTLDRGRDITSVIEGVEDEIDNILNLFKE